MYWLKIFKTVFYNIVRFKKLLQIKCEFISAIKDISTVSCSEVHYNFSLFCVVSLFRGVPLVLRWCSGVFCCSGLYQDVLLFRWFYVVYCSIGVPYFIVLCSGIPGFIVCLRSWRSPKSCCRKHHGIHTIYLSTLYIYTHCIYVPGAHLLV